MLKNAALVCACSAIIWFKLSIGQGERKFFVGWNWKMNGNKGSIDSIVKLLNEHSQTPGTGKSGLEVIKLEVTLRLKIKRNDWLLADTVSASRQSLRFMLSLKLYSSFITLGPVGCGHTLYSLDM